MLFKVVKSPGIIVCVAAMAFFEPILLDAVSSPFSNSLPQEFKGWHLANY